MGEISREIGHRTRNFRKSRHMTLDELANIVCKNKSTLSKYENGEIILDIETIYEIARALGIHVEQLLYCTPDRVPIQSSGAKPAFFSGVSQFYFFIPAASTASCAACSMCSSSPRTTAIRS